jgi:hypothetical protein
MTRHTSAQFVGHANGGTDLPGRAVTALEAVVLDEGPLQWMHVAVRREAFDRRDCMSFVLHRERQARQDALATVHQHGARPARSLVATFLGAEEVQMFAQQVQQGHARVRWQIRLHAVDGNCHDC